jgi:hypothetical protein
MRLVILMGTAVALCSAEPVLSLVPGTDISGAPGDTVGWGYSITNDSATDWLQPEGLASVVLPGDLTPIQIFDYPEVGPGQTVTEPFSAATLTSNCSQLPCGLLEVTIANGASPETVSGTFDIAAEYYADAAETMDDGPAPDLTADYSLTVTGITTTPEPGTLMLLFAGFSALLFRTRKH